MKVKIKLTYRGIPYEVEIEACDKTDINYLLTEDLGSVIDSIQKFIDDVLDKKS